MEDKKPINGLGDAIEAFTEATGIKKLFNLINEKIGKDCGCEKRKKQLNKILNWRKMNDDQKQRYMKVAIYAQQNNSNIDPEHQRILNQLYYEIYNQPAPMSSCGSCIATRLCNVRQVYELS